MPVSLLNLMKEWPRDRLLRQAMEDGMVVVDEESLGTTIIVNGFVYINYSDLEMHLLNLVTLYKKRS